MPTDNMPQQQRKYGDGVLSDITGHGAEENLDAQIRALDAKIQEIENKLRRVPYGGDEYRSLGYDLVHYWEEKNRLKPETITSQSGNGIPIYPTLSERRKNERRLLHENRHHFRTSDAPFSPRFVGKSATRFRKRPFFK